MPFKIVRNDITKMKVDVIVNTANEAPQYSSGVDTAVYLAAGEKQLLEERKKIGWMREGDVAITPGFSLPAKYIIHAVSPCFIDGTFHEEDKLRNCYKKSLELAYQHDCKSIAFPLISTGNFGYPKEEAMRVALDEIHAFLLNHEMEIYLVVFDRSTTKLGLSLYPNLEEYIDQNYVEEKRELEYGDRYFGSAVERPSKNGVLKHSQERAPRRAQVQRFERMQCPDRELVEERYESRTLSCPSEMATVAGTIGDYDEFIEHAESALKKRMEHLSDTFQEYLMYLIEQKKLKAAEVYKSVFISKQLFSKIKRNPEYHPDKATAMRLCVGAQLNIDETKDLLSRAGYALSPCDKRDVIFSFFIENEVYDMIEIDIALEAHDLPCFIE